MRTSFLAPKQIGPVLINALGSWRRGLVGASGDIDPVKSRSLHLRKHPMMSSRRRAGLSEGTGAVSVDLYLKTFLAHRLFDDIHFASQYSGQTPFEFAQAPEIIETWRREILAEPHRHIDIVRGILPACDRAEHRHAQHASRAEFLFLGLQSGYDTVAFHGPNFAQLPTACNRS